MIAPRNYQSSSDQCHRWSVPHWVGLRPLALSLTLSIAASIAAPLGARAQATPFAQAEDIPAEEVSDSNSQPSQPLSHPQKDAPEDKVTALDRGPIHEAFATNAVPIFHGHIAPQPPPPLIDESPSVAIPNARNMVWVDGYWYWSEQLEQYIWISGMYRQVPPGRTWVPGLWSKQPDGNYVRYGGYWHEANANTNNANNANNANNDLPTPPAFPQPIDPGPAPTNDAFWVPGHWNFQNSDYVWAPGYWGQHQAGLIWQPASYMKTAHGYVFVSGYWDYDPVFRGVPSAPILIAPTLFASPNFQHRPTPWAADPSTLLLNTFGQSGDRQYFYGDYYSPNAANAGYFPWYHPEMSQFGRNPLAGFFDWRYQALGIAVLANLNQFYDATMENPPGHSSTRVGFGVSRSRSRFQSVSVSPFGTTLDAVARNPRKGLEPFRVSIGGYGDRPLSSP